MIDQILERLGMKYEDLNSSEQATLNQWLEALNKSQLSLEQVKTYITTMRDSVSQELIDEPEYIRILFFKFTNRKQILLKARLRNYLLLEAFLSTPEKAKFALDKALAGLVSKKQ